MPRGSRYEGRPVVADLAQPDAIRPAPLKRDTFERAAVPVVDDSGSKRLIQSLGIAKSVVPALLSAAGKMHAEGQKQQQEHDLRRWNHYLSTTTQTQQLDDIRAGKAPYTADPYVQGLIEKHHGHLAARELAGNINQEIIDQAIPFGHSQFNVEKYLVERAAPYADNLVKSKHAIAAFRQSLDSVRKTLTNKHQEALGIANQRAIESAVVDNLNRAVVSGFENPNMSGQDIMTAMREQVYKDFGPRLKGGSADLTYGRMDELMLDILEQHADNPKYAKKIIEMLLADRSELLTKGEREHLGKKLPGKIGPLAKVYRHSKQVQGIYSKARKTLQTQFKKDYTDLQTQKDLEALDLKTGQYFGDVEIPNPYGGDPVRLSGSAREKAALQALSVRERAKAGSDAPTIPEINAYINNGYKHDELAARLDGAVDGFLTTQNQGLPVKGEEETYAQRMASIVQMADHYQLVTDINPSTKKWFKASTVKFFDTYSNIVRSGRASTPQEAAALTLQIWNNQDNWDATIAKADLDTAAGDLSVKDPTVSWWNFFGGRSVTNGLEARKQLQEQALIYMRAGGMDAKAALEKAKGDIEKNSVVVNGRLIFGQPGLNPRDAEHFQTGIKEFHKRYKDQLADQWDIDSPEDISVIPHGNGSFVFIHSSTGQPLVVTDRSHSDDTGPDDPVRIGPKGMTFKMIVGFRTSKAAKEVEDRIETMMKRRNPGPVFGENSVIHKLPKRSRDNTGIRSRDHKGDT